METTNKMPFTNGNEFLSWKAQNCDICEQYESESTKRSQAKCKYAFDLDFAQNSGEIPISTINYFGYAKHFHLANCPRLHCGRINDFQGYQKVLKEAENNKKDEIPFEF